MRPILLLSHRPEDAEAERERRDLIAIAGLRPDDVQQRRLDREQLDTVDLEDYSAVIVGGGPFNVSDSSKSALQRRVEHDLLTVVERCIDADFPYFGICYGLGALAIAVGGDVTRDHAEEPSAAWVALTHDGDADPLLAATPELFRAFTGHKEAVASLPEGVAILASGGRCPHQLIRVGRNVYASQFHPELDNHALADRLIVYQDFGYFPIEETAELVRWARATEIGTAARDILRSFILRSVRD